MVLSARSPPVHSMKNPVLMLGLGGFVLGLLALVGGEITPV